MKNKIGTITGFLVGSISFLFLFKIFILDHVPPEDELAPGMVVILAILTGIVCAFIGNWSQQLLRRDRGMSN